MVVRERLCSLCNTIRKISKIDGNKQICSNCYERFYYIRCKQPCSNCGEIKRVRGYRDKRPYCDSCYCYRFYQKPQFFCDFCSTFAKTSAIVDGRRMCNSCYSKSRKKHYLALNMKRRSQSQHVLSEQEINSIITRDRICIYCGYAKNLTLDHIIPISKGGTSDLNNLVTACLLCNLSKNKSDVFVWCKRKGIPVPEVIINLLKK